MSNLQSHESLCQVLGSHSEPAATILDGRGTEHFQQKWKQKVLPESCLHQACAYGLREFLFCPGLPEGCQVLWWKLRRGGTSSQGLSHEDSEVKLAGSLLGELSARVRAHTWHSRCPSRDTSFRFHHKGCEARGGDQLASIEDHFLGALDDCKHP